MKKSLFAGVAVVAMMTVSSAASAQFYTPPKTNYSYGYQPYDDHNPTGFNHPNDMGYGRYVYSPKFKGRRAGPLSYRRFKGY